MPSLINSHLYKTLGIILAGKFNAGAWMEFFHLYLNLLKIAFSYKSLIPDRRQDIFPNENDFVYTTEAFQTDVDKLFKF